MARKFLYAIAVLVVLVFAGRLALTFYGDQLMGLALVPRGGFEAQPALAAKAYADPARWYSRPGQPADLIARNIPSPASMCYDAGANQLVIPMNANNALAFIPLNR